MPNVISSFLVGVGFDFDKKGAEEIGSGIDGVKSKALQLGAVVAGAFGIKALTADFAQSRDQLGKFAEVFGVGAEDVQAFGNALGTEGGTLESFMSQLQNIEQLRAGLLVGDAGFIAQAGRAGIDTSGLEAATTATEAYLALADQFASMTQQQRLNAAAALGLDEASIRLLSQGREAVEAVVAKFRDIRPVSEDMTESAAEFNRQWLEIQQNISGVADAISSQLLPVINSITDEINEWFSEDRFETLRAISALTGATFGVGEPEEIAEATGLPAWLFVPVKDLTQQAGESVGSAAFDLGQTLSDFASPVGLLGDFQFDRQQQSTTDTPPPAQQMTEQTINVKLELDGQMLDNRTVHVVNGMAQTAIDDLTSSTGG